MEITTQQTRALAATAPWREVQWRNPGSQMDPHWYLIADDTIDPTTYWAIVRLIRAEGYQGVYVAQYRPDKPMRNFYLEIGSFVYWAIPPRQLCRTRVEYGQHERLPEQLRLEDYRIEGL